MALKDLPIRAKLNRVLLVTSSVALVLTFSMYFAYEFVTFRQTLVRQLSTMGKVVATNSTAALAFQNSEDATEVLSAVRADAHIVAAALYDSEGQLFACYPGSTPPEGFPAYTPDVIGYFSGTAFVHGYEPVVQGEKRLGTLILMSDLKALYDRLILYAIITVTVIGFSLIVAYLISQRLQSYISMPILQLAETAKAVSDRQDYSVRATKVSNDEIGLLTDAFNQMLARIDEQTREITTFNQRLEERVVERTRELQAANRELEAFSYSVSHDLRAPLRSIHGYMKIFAEDYMPTLDAEGKRLLNVVLTNASRMGQLIDDLLAFSQLGRKDLRKTKVSMLSIVKEVWQEQAELELDRKIDFVILNLPPAIADSVTMKQVWANLISNACKYSRNREVAYVEVGSFVERNTVVYYVKDNGAGFEMKYYDKLFGVFQRLHSEEEFPGTGVGLAIVDRIIKKHGGTVWAKSKLDEGTTFYFTVDDWRSA